jgi:hypothetical protein
LHHRLLAGQNRQALIGHTHYAESARDRSATLLATKQSCTTGVYMFATVQTEVYPHHADHASCTCPLPLAQAALGPPLPRCCSQQPTINHRHSAYDMHTLLRSYATGLQLAIICSRQQRRQRCKRSALLAVNYCTNIRQLLPPNPHINFSTSKLWHNQMHNL